MARVRRYSPLRERSPDGEDYDLVRTAKAQGRSRSELIREALRGMLTAGRESGRRSWKKALAPLTELEQQWVGRWDSTDIIRYYRERARTLP